MGIRSFTYQNIPAALRAQKAGEALRRLQVVLSDPLATTEQRAAAQARQQQLKQWAAGTLPTPEPVEASAPVEAPEPPAPRDHTVEINERISVTENS